MTIAIKVTVTIKHITADTPTTIVIITTAATTTPNGGE